MKDDFENYWLTNRQRILAENEEYRKIKESYKMVSGADMLLYAIPFVAAICILEWSPFNGELLNWALAAVVAIVVFVLCTWFKTCTSDIRSLAEVEDEIKEKCRKEYMRTDGEK